MKGLITEVWAGLRCFANLQVEPTYLPSLNRQQMALVLLDPGKNCWGHERTFDRNYDWSVATARTQGVRKGAGGVLS